MNKQTPVFCDADPSAISIEEAQHRISKALPDSQSSTSIACSSALSRIVAESIHSPISIPPFRASAMDGYAVKVKDCQAPIAVKGKSMAGHPGNNNLPDATCQRITTGARVPDEADAVVQQENVTYSDARIVVNIQPTLGLNIRNPGSDSQQGAELLKAGTVLGAAELALLAAHGITDISVSDALTVALFSTGDELVDADRALSEGQIYDANRPFIKALLESPSVKVIDLGIARDTEQSIEAILQNADEADVIISSGGVSVGEADHVRSVLERRGSIGLWKIAMKPGRPLTFGLIDDGTPYFGLPGNPVSAAITSLLFVRPALAQLLGTKLHPLPTLQMPLCSPLVKNPGRVEYQRGRIAKNEAGQWQVSTTGMQDSHVLSSLHLADCLIELPLDSTGGLPGDMVQVIPFCHFKGSYL
jgi:molybdopterin molybdotransferase